MSIFLISALKEPLSTAVSIGKVVVSFSSQQNVISSQRPNCYHLIESPDKYLVISNSPC